MDVAPQEGCLTALMRLFMPAAFVLATGMLLAVVL
jgi:hypothetical protein